MSESNKVNVIIEVIAVIFLLLLIANFVRLATSGGVLTFGGLLEKLQNFSSFGLTSLYDLTISSDWGLFNFFRDFINIFGTLLSVTLFLANNILNSLWFVIQFVGIFFV